MLIQKKKKGFFGWFKGNDEEEDKVDNEDNEVEE